MPPLCAAVVYVLSDRAVAFGHGVLARGGGRSIARDAARYWGGKAPGERSVFRALVQLEAGGFIARTGTGAGRRATEYVVGNLARAHRPPDCRAAAWRARSADSHADSGVSATSCSADSPVSQRYQYVALTPESAHPSVLTNLGDPTEKVSATLSRLVDATSDRPPDALPSTTAAPNAHDGEGVEQEPLALGCGCELGYLGGVRVVVVPCCREHDH